METQLTVFLGLISFVLIWNAAMLFVLYRMLARAAGKAAGYQSQYAALVGTARSGLDQAAAASGRAVEWSGAIRRQVDGAGGGFERAENWLRYGIAKVDVSVDRFAEDLDESSARVRSAISGPAFRIAAVLHGVKAVLELIVFQNRNGAGRGL